MPSVQQHFKVDEAETKEITTQNAQNNLAASSLLIV